MTIGAEAMQFVERHFYSIQLISFILHLDIYLYSTWTMDIVTKQTKLKLDYKVYI